jgi:hypothetical protein
MGHMTTLPFTSEDVNTQQCERGTDVAGCAVALGVSILQSEFIFSSLPKHLI